MSREIHKIASLRGQSWRSSDDVFSRSSSRFQDEEDDEEALPWAALERLPTYDRVRRGILLAETGGKIDVDVGRLGARESRALIDRLVRAADDDHERFLLKLKGRMDRVGIDYPDHRGAVREAGGGGGGARRQPGPAHARQLRQEHAGGDIMAQRFTRKVVRSFEKKLTILSSLRLGRSPSLLTVAEGDSLGEPSRPTSLVSDLRVPPPPAAAPAAGGWGTRGSRPVHSVGLGWAADGVAMEVVVAAVRAFWAAFFPSRGGVLWSFFARRPSSLSRWIDGSAALIVSRPDPEWRWIRSSFEKKEVVVLKTSATTAAFQRVGSSDLAIGDFPSASGLAPIQGVKRSSGSGAPPTAPVHRPRRDLVGGLICNFFVFLGLSVITLV